MHVLFGRTVFGLLLAAALLGAPANAFAAKKKAGAKAPVAKAVKAVEKAVASYTKKEATQDVSVNPIGLLVGTLGVTYERAVFDENSFTVGGDLALRGVPGNAWTILGAHGSYRWWLASPHRLSGWFVGPAAFLYSLTWTYDYGRTQYSASGIYFGGGAEGGFQWVFKNGFLLNAGANLGYMAGSLSAASGTNVSLPFGGPYFGLLGSVGYAF